MNCQMAFNNCALYVELREAYRSAFQVKPVIIKCPLCSKTFEDSPSGAECLVGGHWTPHSPSDVPPKRMKCCHKYQKEIPQ